MADPQFLDNKGRPVFDKKRFLVVDEKASPISKGPQNLAIVIPINSKRLSNNLWLYKPSLAL